MKWDTCHRWTDIWTNILTISTCIWNMSNQVSVVLYGLIYLSFFKISFQWVSIVSDVSSTVYFRFRNYRITDVVFIFDNIVSFSFPMKKCESESGGAFRRSFPTIFIPTDHRTRLSGNTTESYTQMGPLASWGSATEIKSGGRGGGKKGRRKKRWSFIKLSRATPHDTTRWEVTPNHVARLRLARSAELPTWQGGRAKECGATRHEFWRGQNG